MEKKDECCAEPCTRARTSCAAGCCQQQIDDVAKCQPNDCTPKCGECTSESSAGAGDGTPTEVPACPPPPPPGKGRRELSLSAWQSFVEEEMMDGCSNIGYSSPNPPPACPCDDYYPIDTLSDYNPCAEYKKKGKGPGGPGH